MTFEEWWESFWTPLYSQPEIMNLAFKEIAQKAWNAATEQTEKLRQEDVEAGFHLTNAEFHD